MHMRKGYSGLKSLIREVTTSLEITFLKHLRFEKELLPTNVFAW
jgi:hypothetical protein